MGSYTSATSPKDLISLVSMTTSFLQVLSTGTAASHLLAKVYCYKIKGNQRNQSANIFVFSVHALTTRLHPLHNPSAQLSSNSTPSSRPEPPSGIEVLETENFRLQCFSTLTGTKFLLFTDPTQANVDVIVRRIYELYADYVMKNPFYQTEMPIRCESFDRKLGAYLRPLNSR